MERPSRRTILLAEDEPDVLLAARLMLESAGYEVIEARSGEECLEVVDKTSLDAVFLDLRMPDVDGWTVMEKLRARSTIRRLPVIVLSAHASPGSVKRSVELGASGYIKKPFQAADLTRALDAVLEITTPAPKRVVGQPLDPTGRLKALWER